MKWKRVCAVLTAVSAAVLLWPGLAAGQPLKLVPPKGGLKEDDPASRAALAVVRRHPVRVRFGEATPAQPSAQDRIKAAGVMVRNAGDAYHVGGERIELLRSTDHYVLGGGRPAAQGLQAAGQELSVRKHSAAFSIVRMDGLADRAARRSALGHADLLDAQAGQVKYLYPLLFNARTGNALCLTDGLIVRLAPAATIADLEALGAAAGFRVERKLRTHGPDYLCRVTDPRTNDPLRVSNSLRGHAFVAFAEPDFAFELEHFYAPTDPLYGDQWHLKNTGQSGGAAGAHVFAEQAWDDIRGSSDIIVAIIDTGVDLTHPDLPIWTNPGETPGNGLDDDGNGMTDDVHGWDFYDNDNDPNPDDSQDAHGTSCAGVTAARQNTVGGSGIAPLCQILPVKISGSGAFASYTAVGQAITYAADHADVLSNSWGGGSPSALVNNAIDYAVNLGRGGKGCPVLFASGNSATGFWTYEVSGLAAGTYTFTWTYEKDSNTSSGDDTVWLDDVVFPGGQEENFSGGVMPSGWTTGGSASWTVVTDATHACRGRTGHQNLRSAKAGTIGHSQSTWIRVTKTVGAGTLYYSAWVSSEWGYDYFYLTISGSAQQYNQESGVPSVTTSVAWPASYANSIAVGGTTHFDYRTDYAQYGPELAVVAPTSGAGAAITTTDMQGSPGYAFGDYTNGFGGTSSACPLTAGVVALMLSKDPSLTRVQALDLLKQSCNQVGGVTYSGGRHDEYGAGRVNAQAALAAVAMPEISVWGNGVEIADGDTTPVTDDHTHFGMTQIGAPFTRTYTVRNTGEGELRLSGSPRVEVSGADAADFTVTTQPGSPIPGLGGLTTFQVTFQPTLPGPRNATLSITNNDADENPYTFDIQGVGAAPEISRAPATINVECFVGQDAAPASFEVWNSGINIVNYTISDDAPWLACSPLAGLSAGEHDPISVNFSTAGLPIGSYTGTITISDPGAWNSPQTVVVNLTVNRLAPRIAVSPASLSPTGTIGMNAPSQTFEVWNSGVLTLNYVLGDNAAWLACTPGIGSSDGEHDTITVEYTTSSLPLGQHTAVITVSDPQALNNPVTIPVTLTVQPAPPAIGLGAASFSNVGSLGYDAPSQTLTVRNTGGGTLSYTIADDAPWLSCVPVAGVSATNQNTHTLVYSTAGLAAGGYTATITVTDPNAVNNPQTVPVTLTVAEAAMTFRLKAGFGFAPMSVTGAGISSAEDLCQAVAGCRGVWKWDPAAQNWAGHPAGGPNNFAVEPGGVYLLSLTADATLQLAGRWAAGSYALMPGYNFIALPQGKSGLATAEQLARDIPGCTGVWKWLDDQQNWLSHPLGGLNNFPISAGNAYLVYVTAQQTWP